MSRRGKKIGKWGEQQACYFLCRHGFKVVDRNYHTTVGEIDIIAIKGGDYYFVEVKTRQKGRLDDNTAITWHKQKKLQKTVLHYCYHKNIRDSALILAGLMVVVDKVKKKLNFSLFILF
ncbi:MAG: YraN family protein [bacterium]